MLRFKPHYVSKPWGGSRFRERFGRDLPEGEVGESWELAEVGDVVSVVDSGPREGESLGDLWRAGVLGGSAAGAFPFLVKWLDTVERMSAQVHPDQEFCDNTRCGSPKTEAWLVAEAESKSKLLIGNYPGLDAPTLLQAISRGSLEKWMYEAVPRVGDMYLIEAGTLHSVGAGFLMLEVQQPSDLTFRLCDWERVDETGEPRELHVEQATACIHYHRFDLPRPKRSEIVGPVFRMKIINMGTNIDASGLRVFVAHSDDVRLLAGDSEIILHYGDVCVGEQGDGPISVASGTCALLSEPL